MAGGAGVQFLVLALSSEDAQHQWKGSCALASPLSQLACKWANFHHVPEKSVGFEMNGDELDLQKTPADYSFDPSKQVELLCFPKMEEFMEPDPKEEAVAPPSSSHKSAASAKVARKSEPVEDSKKRKREKQETPEEEGRNNLPEAVKPGAKDEAKKKAKGAVRKAEPLKADGPKAKSSIAKGFVENTSAPPGLDEPIEFLQVNPKKAGSTSFDRYEKYKMGKTVREALALGAAKGDIAYDWPKGFFKRV
ncbi:Poly(A) RNA polymerase GLD2-A [Durusdinium trenchii]|uniref:Poly(A) RNA polymerase GLD2-A n=1 Tax=Durusdinium trenchii TaxID=1381693 RepID=A0ABP0KMF0_9DINO